MEFDIEILYIVGGLLISTALTLVAWLSIKKQLSKSISRESIGMQKTKLDSKEREGCTDENHQQKSDKEAFEDDEANGQIDEMLDAVDSLEINAEPITPKLVDIQNSVPELFQHSDRKSSENITVDHLLLTASDISLAVEHERLQLQLTAVQRDCEKLQSDRDTALQRLNENKQILKDAELMLHSQLNSLQSELADTRAQLNQANNRLVACEQENHNLAAEVIRCKALIENMKVANVRDDHTLSKLHVNLENEDHQWNEKILSAESILQQIRSDNQSLESELNMLQATSERRLLVEC